MWPFSRKYSILESGILDGGTDWHCHILPGVDDGIRTTEEALEVLAFYEQIGIKEVWLTPHIMEDSPMGLPSFVNVSKTSSPSTTAA